MCRNGFPLHFIDVLIHNLRMLFIHTARKGNWMSIKICNTKIIWLLCQMKGFDYSITTSLLAAHPLPQMCKIALSMAYQERACYLDTCLGIQLQGVSRKIRSKLHMVYSDDCKNFRSDRKKEKRKACIIIAEKITITFFS